MALIILLMLNSMSVNELIRDVPEAIFLQFSGDIRPEPDITGYQMNHPTGTRYLNICFVANFLVLCVV